MNNELTLDNLLTPTGPTCLVIKARLEPIGDQDRFQPAGFPEIGHVIYDAPRGNGQKEKVCIIDSAASMANHLESVCMAGPNDTELHADLSGLPYVVCVTDRKPSFEGDAIKLNPSDPRDKVVVTSLTEGHRIASDYFLDGWLNSQWVEEKKETKQAKGGVAQKEKTIPAHWAGKSFREQLREDFGITAVKKNEKYFIHPEDWWNIYQTVFKYDPNSLVHGILLAKEQIKISRLLTASLEGFGAARVGRSGVKFDRLGKTLSGQPIFAVDEETASEIRATFILDLALLRSYGRNGKGLSDDQKKLLLALALWKIKSLLAQPFRYRSQCYLKCAEVEIDVDGNSSVRAANSQSPAKESDQSSASTLPSLFSNWQMSQLISNCQFGKATSVYYPANELFKVGKEEEASAGATDEDDDTLIAED